MTLRTSPAAQGIFLCLALVGCGSERIADTSGARNELSIVIQPLGEVPAEQVAAVESALREQYGARITTAEPTPLPEEAYYAPRNRYRAERLLDALSAAHPEADRVIGITTADISTTKGEHEDWGIFGLARISGRVCVVSTHRLRARGAGEERFLKRLSTVARHEVGHTLGLRHCGTVGCIMEDAKGSVATVDRARDLCDACTASL